MLDSTVEVPISASLLQLGLDPHDIKRRMTEGLVFSLFSDGHISSGRAARLLNISRVDFIALLKERGIAYINYSPSELADEFAAVESMKRDGKP